MRSCWIAVALTLAGSACTDPKATDPDEAIRRACRYLWSIQGSDGGWHSDHYGLLRSGQSLTPLVLSVLLDVPADVAPADDAAIAMGVKFLVSRVRGDGCLGVVDALIPDYPNYATGLAIRVLQKVGGHRELVARMRRHLLGQQFRAANGWRESDPAFGGFGMGGAPRSGEGSRDPGHVDLSMTRVVLEALADWPEAAAARRRSRGFLARCRNADGGFYFSPVEAGINKAGRHGDGFASYGSTTADGILALLAAGVPRDDPAVVAAGRWLAARHRTDRVPGIPGDAPARWADGLRFYYLAVSAAALARMGIDAAPAGRDWRGAMATALLADQRPDGSWVNPVGQVKEDDPVIATSLALRALTAGRTR